MTTLTTPPLTESAKRSIYWLRALAAPRWTLLFFLLTAAGSLAVGQELWSATLLMTLPFSLLVLNLSAAIAVLPRFRRDLPLLVFHLALLALVALFIWTRLVYLDATTALTQGETFEGNLIRDDRGPLHGNSIGSVRFINEGFRESYPVRYQVTENRVRWQDPSGRWHSTIIGGDRPLVIGPYRIYTKPQRGFSPLFSWQDNQGVETLGSVQFNTTVDSSLAPANNWQLPDGTEIWGMLELAQEQEDNERPRPSINLNASEQQHQLVLRLGDERHQLQPGESLTLPGGRLTYLGLDAWMGYRILYDPAQPWILASVAVGLISLLWFYLRQLRGPGRWDSDR